MNFDNDFHKGDAMFFFNKMLNFLQKSVFFEVTNYQIKKSLNCSTFKCFLMKNNENLV